ncbi:hypothetical protein V1283_000160 [Bradyrhizobium sp. AZCC 2262]|uniref:hypothetical protein n=1 Tax=Bradyrhizobium sp. AZCC 2262 TaxID=3117022 RepID=UPI002FF3422A
MSLPDSAVRLGVAPVDVSIISALAALTGAAVGGLTSGMAAWLNHRSQVRVEWALHEKSRRQTLYRDFIEDAAKCYIDALQHDKADIPGLVSLYAKLSAMRAVSSKKVVQRADDVVRKILDAYLEPDKSFVELREMAIDGTIDLLRGFSEVCRDEFERMRPIQF